MADQNFLAIGLMSGTSMDGIDLALIETNGIDHAELKEHDYAAYTEAQRALIASCLGKRHPTEKTDLLDRNLSIWHADAVNNFIKKIRYSKENIDIIGYHGQTIHHDPENLFTWQIGDGQILSDLTGLPVVNDFRSLDVSMGGQGAPLVPIYHDCLTRRFDRPLAILNIGGVANITYIGSDNQLIAFDTGPGNALLNDWVKSVCVYDADGAIAEKGHVSSKHLEQFLKDSYFEKAYPKSLDRDHFVTYLETLQGVSFEDGAATLTEYTVESIAAGIRLLPDDLAQIYVTGGGRHNKFMMSRLEEVTGCSVHSVSELSWNGDSLEAEAFGFLAVRHLLDLDICFPLTTGAKQPTKGGCLYQPSSEQTVQKVSQNYG